MKYKKYTLTLMRNYSEDFHVVPEYNIPDGYLVDVFRFSDGSPLSILTIKNQN